MADDLLLRIPNLMRLTGTTATPNIVRVGDIRYTDGVSWDPGSGVGYYSWNGTIWEFLGTDYNAIYTYLFGTSTNDVATGWRIQPCRLSISGNPANAPSWAAWKGDIYELSWGTTPGVVENELEFQLQHDYKLGTDVYFNVHWTTAASATGDVKWYIDATYAKGYAQAVFSTTVTTSAVATAAATAYTNHTTEIKLSTSGGSASQLDTDNLEPNGIIILRLYRDASDAADTLDVAPFVHLCDLQYQVDRFATLNRSPNFYA